MQALRKEVLPPSGVEYATSLRLTPSTYARNTRSADNELPKTLCNLVVSRSTLLRIYEVREEPATLGAQGGDGRERRSRQKDAEAVEGEVEMDTQGEGFVNMGSVKPVPSSTYPPTTTKLYFVREYSLHGIIVGIESLRDLPIFADGADRLLISFKDAKVALMEWSPEAHELITVSIHTYERAPQLTSVDATFFKSELRVDPSSRCVALILPQDCAAILPFQQGQVDLDMEDGGQAVESDIPYSPSYILDFAGDVDERIRNVIDFVFLPGFNNPTAAILFQNQQTWTGRLKEFKDTVSLFIFTLDVFTRKYQIITVVEHLPYDCISLIPCSPSLGGVVILASNALIYVDQASRRVALPVNGWASRTTDIPLQTLRDDEEARNLHLEGSCVASIDDKTLFVVLKDGTVYPVEIVSEGTMVSRLSMGSAIAQTTIPSVLRSVGDGCIFVGSTVAPSVLLKTGRTEEEIPRVAKQESSPAAVVDVSMDLDDDEDIYGDIKDSGKPVLNGSANAASSAVETRSVIHLSLCDSLPAHGTITDMTFSLTRNGDRPAAELVAATGAGRMGGFTLFQRDLPVRVKRKLHVIGGARGIWSIPVKQSSRTNGTTSRIHENDIDTVIVSTDANPSPGLTRIASRSTRSDITINTRITITTIGAGPFFQRTAILHVTTESIRVLEADGTERQSIKDMDGNVKRPKIRACSISDPFVLIFREDDSIGLFVGDAERGRIRRKDMTPMGEKISRYLTGCFFSDQSGLFQVAQEQSAAAPTTTSLEAAVDSTRGTQWLLLVRPQGVLEIWTLPKLTVVFSTTSVATLQSVLLDSYDPPALSLPEDPPRKPRGSDIDQVLVTPLGESSPKLHVLVLLRCGQLAIYEAVGTSPAAHPPEKTRTATLPLQFVKVFSRAFDVRAQEIPEKTILSEQKRIVRLLIPFATSPSPGCKLSGVFFAGDHPCWIIATDKDGVRIHTCGYATVNAFTACSVWESKNDFIMHTDEGPCLLEWLPDVNVGTAMPSRSMPRTKPYSNVVFEPSTGLIVATSSLRSRFAPFDEDGNKLWEPDAINIDYPHCDTSCLELISADFAYTLDGYEFATNEFVNALDCVTLETLSTETGTKDFIAVGTTIDRGEDLACKGATYVFEVVEVVADIDQEHKRKFKLRLHCRDESKGPVTAVCGMNGYLVSSMGQKLFVRAFDLDERLVGVAFLDVGVYVTSIRVLKNLMLIGDAVKSVWFVAFQEDPFKLSIIAKDIQALCANRVDFLFSSEGFFHIVVADEEGIIRLYDFDPTDPESRNGQQLIRRTEYHNQVECRTSLMIARRTGNTEEAPVPDARLVYGAMDGSVFTLVPIEAEAYKRLELLQGQLIRNVQHVAGLNPKAFHIVRNDLVSKPLSKGILDGNLLAAFEDLPLTGQSEMTRQIGTEPAEILKDWIALVNPW